VTLIADHQRSDLPKGASYDEAFPPEMLTQLKSLGIRTTIIKEGKENDV
jgi:hypothetical protein